MIYIRFLCRGTLCDRVVVNTNRSVFDTGFNKSDRIEKLEQLDLSTLHKFTRIFYVDDELMMNFHIYEYCQQMQKVLGSFIVNFCEKNSNKINNNKDVETFVNTVSSVFNYSDPVDDATTDDNIPPPIYSDNDSCSRIIELDESDSRLLIDDVLLVVTFNVIEYSMNRILLEYYWDYRGLFPLSNSMVMSKSIYSRFMTNDLDDVIGRANRETLLKSMKVLYYRFRSDNALFLNASIQTE
jgi:hypothetical protein